MESYIGIRTCVIHGVEGTNSGESFHCHVMHSTSFSRRHYIYQTTIGSANFVKTSVYNYACSKQCVVQRVFVPFPSHVDNTYNKSCTITHYLYIQQTTIKQDNASKTFCLQRIFKNMYVTMSDGNDPSKWPMTSLETTKKRMRTRNNINEASNLVTLSSVVGTSQLISVRRCPFPMTHYKKTRRRK